MKFKPCLHFHSIFIPLYCSCEDACLCSVHSRLLSRVGERAMRIARTMCGRTDLDCICLRIRIRMEIRKETGHEQWLAALRNNVVFVGSFYLPRQECSLQSASKFSPLAAQFDRIDHLGFYYLSPSKLSSVTNGATCLANFNWSVAYPKRCSTLFKVPSWFVSSIKPTIETRRSLT